jgi:hypothetical protein
MLEPADLSGDSKRGQLDGLTSDLPAPISTQGTDRSELYRAGFAVGRLITYLGRQGRFDPGRLPTMSTYAAAVTEPAQEPPKTEDPLRTLERRHTVACILLARKGMEVTDEEELTLFRWLADELGVEITTHLLGRYETLRKRRLERV